MFGEVCAHLEQDTRSDEAIAFHHLLQDFGIREGTYTPPRVSCQAFCRQEVF